MTRIFLQAGRVPAGGVLPNGEVIPAEDVPKRYPAVQVPEAVKDIIMVDIFDSPDVYSPEGTPVTMQVVGFILRDTEGAAIKAKVLAEFAAFSDVDCSAPCSDGVALFNATKGRIIAGENTPALKIETDVNGEFSCLLQCLTEQTVWTGANSTFGGPFLHCHKRDSVTFHHHPVQ